MDMSKEWTTQDGPKRYLNGFHQVKWKGGRHCRRWTDDIQESMEAKQLQENLWRNRREWQRGYEKQRQVIEHSLYIDFV